LYLCWKSSHLALLILGWVPYIIPRGTRRLLLLLETPGKSASVSWARDFAVSANLALNFSSRQTTD
jgi:hypothetical protein